ncbi:MAG TPA: PAS domain S-box protein, partial [Candidatus Marinimicrobia bacterium]|nr:PAS domain S-box protein [Candidatus Neomarinimicrobiota bacterium]
MWNKSKKRNDSAIKRITELETELERKNELQKELLMAEKRNQYLRNILLAIRNVKQLIVQEENPGLLIHKACDLLVESLGYYSAWIAILDDGLQMTNIASAGFDSKFPQFEDMMRRDNFPICMNATLNSSKTMIISDPKIDCPGCPLNEKYEGSAVLASALKHKGNIYGLMAISIPKTFATDAEALSLFEELAGDLAFALHKIKTYDALKASQIRYESLFQGSRDGFVAVNLEGRIIDANQAFCDMLGYTLDELRDFDNFYVITPEKWRQWESDEIWQQRLLKQGFSGIYEKEYLHKDGSAFPVEQQAFAVKNAKGEIDYLWGLTRDISDRKKREKELAQGEKLKAVISPEGDIDTLSLEDILNAPAIQSIIDHFYQLTHIGVGIVDNAGKVIVANGWQDICALFHRVHSETQKNCIESDTILSQGLKPGQTKAYKCKNGLSYISTPLIVGNRQVGNIFLGQFFYDDEEADYDFFRKQAQKYTFDEEDYLAALERVPRWKRETVEHVITFYAQFADLISSLSYGNLKLARVLEENKRSSEALQESEALFRSIYENMPVGVARVSLDNRIQQANQKYCKMLGYNENELIGTNLSMITDPEILKENMEKQKALAMGEIDHFEMEKIFLRKNKEKVYGLLSANLIRDTEGNPKYILGVVNDITLRKKAEVLIRQSQEKYQSLFNNMPNGLYRSSHEGYFVEANPAFIEMLGYESLDELKKVHIPTDIYVHSSERELLYYNPEFTEKVEIYRLRRKDGRIIWVEDNARYIKNESGKIIFHEGICKEITNQKEAEEQLRKSEALFHSVWENANDGMRLTDKDGTILDVNRAYCKMINLKQEELIGKSLDIIYT